MSPRRNTASATGIVAAVIALALAVGGGAGCKKERAAPAASDPTRGVPQPLVNPAGYCDRTCPRRVQCRLGQTSRKLFDQEVRVCRERCYRWIRDHAAEAKALHRCYGQSGCGVLRACLAEVRRIVQDRRTPAKVRECNEMCATLGTCQGDEKDCRLRCRTGEVPIFRALLRCGTKKCPDIRTCVRKLVRR